MVDLCRESRCESWYENRSLPVEKVSWLSEFFVSNYNEEKEQEWVLIHARTGECYLLIIEGRLGQRQVLFHKAGVVGSVWKVKRGRGV